VYSSKQQQPTGNKAMQETVYTTNDPAAAAKYVKRIKGPLFMEVLISGRYTDPMLTMVVKSELAWQLDQYGKGYEFQFNVTGDGSNYLHISEEYVQF